MYLLLAELNPQVWILETQSFQEFHGKKSCQVSGFLVMAMGCEHRGVLGLKLDPPLVRCLIQPGPDRSHGLCCQRPLTNEAPGSAALQLCGTRFPQPCALGSGRSVGPPWLFFGKGLGPVVATHFQNKSSDFLLKHVVQPMRLR